MSSEDLERKPIRRTNSGNIIVYYPETEKLEKIKFDDQKAQDLTFRCRAPNVGSRAMIYAPEKENSSLLLASIKLTNLGWQTSLQRLCGKCNDVYTPNPEAARAA